jgi:hypothetical protein
MVSFSGSIDMTLFERTDHATCCPYKCDCAYFSIPAGGEHAVNAVWTYENPYEALAPIRNHLAFNLDRRLQRLRVADSSRKSVLSSSSVSTCKAQASAVPSPMTQSWKAPEDGI